MDHFSKLILCYRIEKHSSGQAIRSLLQEARNNYKPRRLKLLIDGGPENINIKVSHYLNALPLPTEHMIAQKDVVFSNSMIEAFNKTIKHLFLYPANLNSGYELSNILKVSVHSYNTIRTQWSLGGNTPIETFNKLPIGINKYKIFFTQQRMMRRANNMNDTCKICLRSCKFTT